MKRSVNERAYMAQIFIILGFLVLMGFVFFCFAAYDYLSVFGYFRHRLHEWPFATLVGAWLLSAALCFMLGVRHFLDFIREREDFIHAALHDLRTPVAGLKLLIGHDDETAKLVTERMRRMIDNLGDFINRGGKRPAPRFERVPLLDAYRESYALLADDFAGSESGPVALECERDGLEVLADRVYLQQILWNLLGNEWKYASPYGAVKVILSAEGDYVYVRFIDDGKGMSRRERRHAFDRYYRARTVRESGKGGFGIGLCSAREMARAMGGELTVEANRPKGCVFTLCLKAF